MDYRRGDGNGVAGLRTGGADRPKQDAREHRNPTVVVRVIPLTTDWLKVAASRLAPPFSFSKFYATSRAMS